ncbi:MAG: GntR family transcriptional regulator [Actinobacteria bacterium]|nr:GntR family transcriptional regulator [Actinomycetota bacterium]
MALAYERISDDIRSQIDAGSLLPADRLPAETALAERYGVTRMTVRHALTSLVDGGYLYRRHGVGTFVADPARRRSLNRLRSFAEELREAGREVSTEMLASAVVPAAGEPAAELGLEQGEEVVFLARLRLVDGGPAAVQQSWVPRRLAPGLEDEPLLEGSLYRTLEARFGVVASYADQRILAVAADVALAEALAVEPGSPLLQTDRTARDHRDVAVEHARSWSRPEFELVTHLER